MLLHQRAKTRRRLLDLRTVLGIETEIETPQRRILAEGFHRPFQSFGFEFGVAQVQRVQTFVSGDATRDVLRPTGSDVVAAHVDFDVDEVVVLGEGTQQTFDRFAGQLAIGDVDRRKAARIFEEQRERLGAVPLDLVVGDVEMGEGVDDAQSQRGHHRVDVERGVRQVQEFQAALVLEIGRPIGERLRTGLLEPVAAHVQFFDRGRQLAVALHRSEKGGDPFRRDSVVGEVEAGDAVLQRDHARRKRRHALLAHLVVGEVYLAQDVTGILLERVSDELVPASHDEKRFLKFELIVMLRFQLFFVNQKTQKNFHVKVALFNSMLQSDLQADAPFWT